MLRLPGRDPNAEVLAPNIAIVVHSHLRWDFVWQRPQQIISRLAENNPVYFIEEPLLLDDVSVPVIKVDSPFPRVTRVVPRLPSSLRDDYDGQMVRVRSLLHTLLDAESRAKRLEGVVQWFYTPMPAPIMLQAFGEAGVVYDCMDELAQFRFAPAGLRDRERLLLGAADVVFTGGRRLYESKSQVHHNVHFFGCGVDAAHFGRARDAETEVPGDARDLARPVFGYFGVVDERLDYALLEELALAEPLGTVLIVGPLAKVSQADLPQAANIRWLGQRSYADLPRYLKAFDVCLMPFALNEATEFINPTKTLEYMAGGKPIVSTPVRDVVRNFAPIVRIAPARMGFVEEAQRAARAPDPQIVEAGIQRAAQESWENIIEQMQALIAAAVERRADLRSIAIQHDAAARAASPRLTTGMRSPVGDAQT